jgi:hypothetical protein
MIHSKMESNASPEKNALNSDGGLKNIASAGTGYETISQKEGSLQHPCEIAYQGVNNYFGIQNRPYNL